MGLSLGSKPGIFAAGASTFGGSTQSLDGPPNLPQLLGKIAGLTECLRAAVIPCLYECGVILPGLLTELHRKHGSGSFGTSQAVLRCNAVPSTARTHPSTLAALNKYLSVLI